MIHVVGPWGEQTRLPFWVGGRGSGISLGLPFPWAWRVGLRFYFLNPIKKYFCNLIISKVIINAFLYNLISVMMKSLSSHSH